MSPAASIRRQISLDASWWSASVVRMNRSKEMFSASCMRWNTSELRRASSAVGTPAAAAACGHLQAVLVGPGQETHVEAVEPLEPRDRVGGDVFVRVPHVRRSVGIRDRGGDVVGLSYRDPPYCVRVSSNRSGKREAPPAPGAAGAPDRRPHPPRRVRRPGRRATCGPSSTVPRRSGWPRWSPSPTIWSRRAG